MTDRIILVCSTGATYAVIHRTITVPTTVDPWFFWKVFLARCFIAGIAETDANLVGLAEALRDVSWPVFPVIVAAGPRGIGPIIILTISLNKFHQAGGDATALVDGIAVIFGNVELNGVAHGVQLRYGATKVGTFMPVWDKRGRRNNDQHTNNRYNNNKFDEGKPTAQ